jgi:hypothetical protein
MRSEKLQTAAVAAALALSAGLLASAAQGSVVYLNPNFGVSVSDPEANIRYRMSGTNWDQMISVDSNVSTSTIASQANLGNNAALNGRLFNFEIAYTAGSGFAFRIFDNALSSTIGWTTPVAGESPTRSFNAMKIYVQAGSSFGTGVTSALAEASNLSFSASGLTNVGSLRNLSRAWSGTDQGLDIQYLYSTADLSQVDWRLAGQLRLAYSGPSNANIDERLKFNIKVGQGVPTPGAVSALALAGLVATRRRR